MKKGDKVLINSPGLNPNIKGEILSIDGDLVRVKCKECVITLKAKYVGVISD